MIYERFEDPGLSQYSYVVGCAAAGRVAVVDPRRTVGDYLRYAERQGLRISHVLETHIHADFASGARELAARTGAELLLSAYDDGETYEVAFDHRPIEDGQAIEIGSVKLEALHTPGHTPEHLSFLVYEGSRSRRVPMMMLSGDFLFVGSLGRPDLLGEDAKRGLAEMLFQSAREKLEGLPDGLEIHPCHGAGSMCGSGMSGRPQSTLGFERIANPYLDPKLTREQFVERILSNVPPFPDYYRLMKQLNSEGPALLDGLPGLQAVDAEEFLGLAESGHVVIDLRDPMSFGSGHIPGSFCIGAGRLLSQWAAWVVPYDTPILLVAPGDGVVPDAVGSLVRVGLDDVRGYLRGGIDSWEEAGYPLAQTLSVLSADVHRWVEDGSSIDLLDVRTTAEWESGHIGGATHIMGGELAKNLDRVPRDGDRLAVICGGGYRSTVAVSLLERAGIDNLMNVVDGMTAWHEAGLPETREA